MARWKKVALALAVTLLVVLAAAVQAVVGWRALVLGPRARPLTTRTFETTPDRLARGRYLAEAHLGCAVCHSERDWQKPGAPPREGRLLAGVLWSGEGMPWLTAPNLTPDPETGIGRVSDDALARAIREGVGASGRALFPLMPWQEYRRLPDEDVAALVVYLRSLSPVHNPLPPSTLPFPLSVVVRGLPAPLDGPVPAPDLTTPARRGEFLLRTGSCHHCHTPMRRGQLVAELDMAGGGTFETPAGPVAPTNVTPDETGIGHYDEATFVQVMRTGKLGTLHPFMPWAYYERLADEDLRAIYAYLRTLRPVRHVVTNAAPPTACAVCGGSHGGGERNRP
jgi:mono/diheme cytochrome c family protein